MKSTHLGDVAFDPNDDWFVSQPTSVSPLREKEVRFIFEGLEEDQSELPRDFEEAIGNFLSLSPNWVEGLVPHLWEYYKDVISLLEDGEFERLDEGSNILDCIRLGDEVSVGWDCDEKNVYLSFEGGCEWEIEHGLQVCLKAGNTISKVGPFDGHVTNVDAYARPEFENVVYVKHSDL